MAAAQSRDPQSSELSLRIHVDQIKTTKSCFPGWRASTFRYSHVLDTPFATHQYILRAVRSLTAHLPLSELRLFTLEFGRDFTSCSGAAPTHHVGARHQTSDCLSRLKIAVCSLTPLPIYGVWPVIFSKATFVGL